MVARWLPLLTLVVRAVWLVLVPPQPLEAVDARGYDLLAHNLLGGVGLSLRRLPPFCPTMLRTPGYPLFLAAAYRLLGGVRGALLLQMLLEVLTAALVIRLGREVADRRVGQAAGLLYALNGTSWRYTGDLYAEILLLPVLSFALLATVRFSSPRGLRALPSSTPLSATPCPALPVQALAVGVGWGAALLVKPNLLYLAAVLLPAAALLRRRRGGRRWALPLVVAGLILLPWVVRNGVRLGRWRLSDAFLVNRARVSAVATLAELRHLEVEPWTPTWEALYAELVAETARAEGWDSPRVEVRDCREALRREEAVAARADRLLRAHPWAALMAHLRGVGRSLLDPGHRFWYAVLTGSPWETTGVVPNIWRRMGWSLERGAVGDALLAFWRERVLRPPWGAFLLWWGLVVMRVALWRWGVRGFLRLRGRGGGLLAATVLYHLLLPGPIAYERFTLPAIPAIVVLVAAGIQAVKPAQAPPVPAPECAATPPPVPSPR